MKIVCFTHSLRSCWNHGNAHFLRGVLRELAARGHDVTAQEAGSPWSLANLLQEHGEAGLAPFRRAYPELAGRVEVGRPPEEAVADADLVLVHEWNEPALIAELGALRRRGGRFTLLFHDTHHRAVSDPDFRRTYDLTGYDGVLAFGESLAVVYRRWGWGDRVFVWHEAADIGLFRPPAEPAPRSGLVWIGNWGDEERSAELESLLLAPARAAGLALDIHGVRYPPSALSLLARYGARWRGWLANPDAPEVFARHLATVHVPRRFYCRILPGIPTIRVFEALACGVPLISTLWRDVEGLFAPGADYLVADTTAAVTKGLRALQADAALRRELVAAGRAAIEARHTCAHRAEQLLDIAARLRATPTTEAA